MTTTQNGNTFLSKCFVDSKNSLILLTGRLRFDAGTYTVFIHAFIPKVLNVLFTRIKQPMNQAVISWEE